MIETMKFIGTIWMMILVLALSAPVKSQGRKEFDFRGQAIGWAAGNPADPLLIQGGLRYIPEISFSLPAGKLSFDGKFSGNFWASGSWENGEDVQYDGTVSPYRLWLRLAGDQFELRAGLQKINFGSARLFRPLMWFESIDPRDPLQLTDGVYGLLGRYYFLNNANIWLWALYGDDKTKGWELFPSKQNSVEYGGRIQLPLLTGEIAASYHHRIADPAGKVPGSVPEPDPAAENRIGIDAKMDLLVGLWAEAALIHQDLDFSPLDFKSMINAGMDYTFGLGSGLNVMVEGFSYMQGEHAFGSEEEIWFGLLSASYPLNIVHNLTAMFFYDFSNQGLYRFINWSMTFDRWNFYLMAFWNPEQYQIYNLNTDATLYSGWGFQLMAVFNH